MQRVQKNDQLEVLFVWKLEKVAAMVTEVRQKRKEPVDFMLLHKSKQFFAQ